MNRTSLIPALIALVIVGSMIGGGFYWTRNNHLELKGAESASRQSTA